ncbi:unnamed protein product [Urochloa decumbens]|uniref:NmrA-like domain-containing protein n=1 Tax=Urochloa decumbens TaxID=240449 RepID=A0ABC9DFN5_9POAL
MAPAGETKLPSRVLVIGGTGFIGRHIVAASAREGHPTFVLVRDAAPTDPAKAAVLQGFRDAGVTIVKRFFPTEFGNDVDRVHPVEPAKSLMFGAKARIRRSVEAEGIPYTFVAANFSTGRFLPTLAQVEVGITGLPTNKVLIVGDGNVKGIFTTQEDIGTYTVKAVDDPRTLNKILYMRPQSNILSYNELVSLWEKKVGKTFQRVYIPEDEVLKKIEEFPVPLNIGLSISHSVWVKGDHTNFEIEPSFGVEATQLYPDVKYTTVDEYLNRLL